MHKDFILRISQSRMWPIFFPLEIPIPALHKHPTRSVNYSITFKLTKMVQFLTALTLVVCCQAMSTSWHSVSVDLSWPAVQGSKLDKSVFFQGQKKGRILMVTGGVPGLRFSIISDVTRALWSHNLIIFFMLLNWAATHNSRCEWQKWWMYCEANHGRYFGLFATVIRSKGCLKLLTSESWELRVC